MFGLRNAASFEKCEAIAATENESPNGPKCVDDTCQRRCNPGYTALKPTKVRLDSQSLFVCFLVYSTEIISRPCAKKKMWESLFGARRLEDV